MLELASEISWRRSLLGAAPAIVVTGLVFLWHHDKPYTDWWMRYRIKISPRQPGYSKL